MYEKKHHEASQTPTNKIDAENRRLRYYADTHNRPAIKACLHLSMAHRRQRRAVANALTTGAVLEELLLQPLDRSFAIFARDRLKEDFLDGPQSWNDTMRLRTMLATEDQMIYEPLVFQHDQPKRVRSILHDGTYGVYGELLDESLSFFERFTDRTDHYELTGVISELTTLALLNRSQGSDRAARLSDTEDDMSSGIDLLYYRKSPAAITVTPLQVKSSRQIEEGRYSANIAIINANQFASTTDRFYAARLVVDELNGTISDEGTQQLDIYVSHLLNDINRHHERQAALGRLGIEGI